MSVNWKYKKWKDSPVSEYKDVETYIGMEILPEDIELFSYILLPPEMHIFLFIFYSYVIISSKRLK